MSNIILQIQKSLSEVNKELEKGRSVFSREDLLCEQSDLEMLLEDEIYQYELRLKE